MPAGISILIRNKNKQHHRIFLNGCFPLDRRDLSREFVSINRQFRRVWHCLPGLQQSLFPTLDKRSTYTMGSVISLWQAAGLSMLTTLGVLGISNTICTLFICNTPCCSQNHYEGASGLKEVA